MDTDTLLILPTIAANQARALDALRALSALPMAVDILMVIDEVTEVAPITINGRQVTFNTSPTRRGLVHAYRAGFSIFALNPYSHLILMEDGVLVTPGWDTRLRRTLDAHPDFGWVACGQQENDKAPFTPLCSMMTRAAALATNGGPDEAYAPCQFDDGDMLFRLLQAGFRPHAVDHLVSQPESRTSRVGTVADDWALIEAHRVVLQERWGVTDVRWDMVPVHRGCGACR